MSRTKTKKLPRGDRCVCVTARLLGPTLVNGGLVLLTARMRGEDAKHRIYVLDDLYRQLCENPNQPEYGPSTQALVEAVIRKRNRILRGTTNYFSGVTGKVVKIL